MKKVRKTKNQEKNKCANIKVSTERILVNDDEKEKWREYSDVIQYE